MLQKVLSIFVVIFLWTGTVLAQSAIPDSVRRRMTPNLPLTDSLIVKRTIVKDSTAKIKPPRLHYKPKKATLFAIIPGGGQIYNKQYWKLPFVYAGFGVSAYFINYFSDRYKDFVKPYIASYDDKGVLIKGKETSMVFNRSLGVNKEYTIDQITRGKDLYRRYRDLNTFILIGVWALTAIEANVSAHLRTFDVSDDISMKIQPDAFMLQGSGVIGAKVVFGFK